ncbi:MAG: hypothetical protein KC561_12430 [Myxococcales bacterium]|nr:hypothetical protein [Myxococcales bacterium]
MRPNSPDSAPVGTRIALLGWHGVHGDPEGNVIADLALLHIRRRDTGLGAYTEKDMKCARSLLAFLVVFGSALPASADDDSSVNVEGRAENEADHVERTVGIGFRIGGLGFRRTGGGSTSWDGCRMNGIGVVAAWSFTPHWFLGASIEGYQALGSTTERERMDRLSLMTLASLGFVFAPDWIVTPIIEVGGGLDVAMVEAIDSSYDETKVGPAAFVGLGAQVNAGEHVRLGANLRTYMMYQYSQYEEERTATGFYDTGYSTDPALVIAADWELASQFQLWVRYDL